MAKCNRATTIVDLNRGDPEPGGWAHHSMAQQDKANVLLEMIPVRELFVAENLWGSDGMKTRIAGRSRSAFRRPVFQAAWVSFVAKGTGFFLWQLEQLSVGPAMRVVAHLTEGERFVPVVVCQLEVWLRVAIEAG